MRPGGGIFGGMSAIGGGTEHQGFGTPHLHAEGHIVSVYQYHTLQEIVEKLRNEQFAVQDIVKYQEWMHYEDVLDETAREELMPELEN